MVLELHKLMRVRKSVVHSDSLLLLNRSCNEMYQPSSKCAMEYGFIFMSLLAEKINVDFRVSK